MSAKTKKMAVMITVLFFCFVRSTLANEKIKDQLWNSSVLIINYVDDGYMMGTGVLIDKQNRLVATAYHVMDSENTAAVFRSIRNTEQERFQQESYMDQQHHLTYELNLASPGRVVARSKLKDLAILQLSWLPDDMVETPLADEEPDEGDILYFMGNPAGRRPFVFSIGETLTSGWESWTYDDGHQVDANVVRFTGESYGGKSGGPVVNRYGELVGIISGSTSQSSQKVTAIAASEVRKLRRTIKNKRVVSILNDTDVTVHYRFKFSHDEKWHEKSIKPNTSTWWWTSTEGGQPEIEFDWSFDEGYQAKSHELETAWLYFGQDAGLKHKQQEVGDYLQPTTYKFLQVSGGINLFVDD